MSEGTRTSDGLRGGVPKVVCESAWINSFTRTADEEVYKL